MATIRAVLLLCDFCREPSDDSPIPQARTLRAAIAFARSRGWRIGSRPRREICTGCWDAGIR